jgi:putative transposase
VAVSYLVQQIKGASSHLLNHEVAPDRFKWQGAYGAFTVSRENLDGVKAYVLRQKEHHARNDVWPEWERVWLPDPIDSGD